MTAARPAADLRHMNPFPGKIGERRKRSSTLAALTVVIALCGGSGTAALTIKTGSAWDGPEIPVCWETPRSEHVQERRMIRKALAGSWERESAVRFTGWGACRADARGIRVSLEPSHPSAIGRGRELDGAPRGIRLPTLWSLAALSVNLKAPVHEFGHALGFGHEYARADAPEPGRCGLIDPSGARYVETDAALTPFDPDSIMVACVAEAALAFSRGLPMLSALDIFGLVSTYGSHPDSILGEDATGDQFGAALLRHDFDGDGAADLAVGAPGKAEGAGAVFLYRGHAVRGFRPWLRIDAPDGAASFGSALAWIDGGTGGGTDGERGGVMAVSADGGGGFGFAFRGDAAPSAIGPVGPGRSAGTVSVRLDAAATPGFPEHLLFAEGSAVDADLNGDGRADRILGSPASDGRANGSGVVMILRGTKSGGFEPWYWFGQAY